MKVCFNGCSFTAGAGFDINDRGYIYDRLLTQKFNFESDNVSINGSSNYTIFMRAVDAIVNKKYDLIFVQWTMLNRIWLSPGPECYYSLNDENPAFEYREIVLSAKEKQTFNNTLLMLNHDYQNIFDLIDYCIILNELARNKTKLIYINGLVLWSQDLAIPLSNNLSESLSSYSKKLLDFDHRDDKEIIKYFTKLQNKFKELDTSNWVNIFESFIENAIDVGPLGHHPGIKSHQWMADQTEVFLNERNLV